MSNPNHHNGHSHHPAGHHHVTHNQAYHTHAQEHAHVQDAAMAAHKLSKGKQKEVQPQNGAGTGTPDKGLSAMLDEAIHTNLSPPSPTPTSSSIDYEAPTPITVLPEAHHAPKGQPGHPHLLTQLTRTAPPTSGLNYASPERKRHHQQHQQKRINSISHSGSPPQDAESSTAWQRGFPTTAVSDDPFPDLDPSTGLPLDFGSRLSARRDSSSSTAPSLHLQRTITGLLQTPPAKEKSTNSYLPSIPSMSNLNLSLPRVSLPSAPTFDFASKRPLSSSAPNEDWTSWATGWWGGNKGKVDEMMTEDDQADTVEEEKEKLRRKYRSPQNPIVFCHGLLGFDYIGPSSLPPLQISHWRGIREVLESNGSEVMIARVPATSSIKDRAKTLDEMISAKFPGREVNLIGHSMGGLDCRYLISELRPKAFRPISLTTISTPHRGSPFADYVIDNVIGRDRLPSLLSLVEALKLPTSGGDGTAFSALGTHSMKEFNAQIIDREDVKYYSWGASFEPGLLDTFRWPHSVILAKEGPNDGLVSVNSARWGEYRGTLLGVNHLDLVGWVNHVRYVLSGWTGNPITFKPATFYLEVADYLAEQGF